jgi:hypothetical protein
MNANPTGLYTAALDLLAQSRLREDELEIHFKNAVASEYWERLNPTLSVCKGAGDEAIEGTTIESSVQQELLRKLSEEGYCQTPRVLASSLVQRMSGCIEGLRKEDWPPIFSFMYDEF